MTATDSTGLLTLPGRLPDARTLNALPAADRLTLIRSVPGRQKYRLLLDAADAHELVPQLPAQDLYLLLRELGPEDLPELLALASTEQFTTFIDLDCWVGDELQPRRGLHWLALLLEAGEAKVLEFVREGEPELLALLLRRLVRVVSGPEGIEDEDDRIEAQRRDGGYQLEFLDVDGSKIVAGFLDVLFRNDPELFLQVMEGVRWEMLTTLEEEAYGWRAGRLLDLGFPAPSEARRVYAWLDPERYAGAAKPSTPQAQAASGVAPGFVLAAARPKGLLQTILAAGLDEACGWELSFLANKVLLADGVDPGDAEAVQRTLRRVGDTLGLALEHLAGDDATRAADLFRDCWQEELFRLGHSLTLRLQRRARALLQGSIGAFIDDPSRGVLEALAQPLPGYPLSLDDPGRSGERTFVRLADVQRAERALTEIEAQQRLFCEALPFALPAGDEWDLTGCLPERVADLTLSGMLLTAVANRILGRELQPVPLAAGDLPDLHRLVSRKGRLDPELRDRTVAWLEELTPGIEPFALWALEQWQQDFCAVPAAALDPRHVGGLIVRLSGSGA